MTIPAGDSSVSQHTGNGVADTFDYEFKINDESDLLVTTTDTDGNDTVLTLTTDYTVSGVGDDAGGSVTLVAGALTEDYGITIEDNVPLSQLTPFGNQAAFYGSLHESALDKLTRLVRRVFNQLNTSLKIPSTVQGVSTDLPKPSALNLLRWNSGASALENVSTDTLAGGLAAEAEGYKDDAETAKTAAEAAQVAAEAAESDAEAAAGASAFNFTYSNTITMADPGAGVIRLNSVTLSAVTAIAIDDTTADAGNPDISPYIATWDDATGTDKGTLVIRKSGDPDVFLIFTVTGLTDNTGWTELAVSHLASNGPISDADSIYVQFLRHGDDGGGDLLSSNNLSDVASASAARSNLGLAIGSDVQAYDPDTAKTDVAQEYTAGQRSDVPTLSAVSDTFTPDMDAANWFQMNIDGSDTLANPSNLTPGQSGVIYITKTAGSDSLAYGTYWPTDLDDFAGMGAGDTGAIYYSVVSATSIDASAKYPVGV